MEKGLNISKMGYMSNSPDRFNPYNIIPSNRITMNSVPFPVFGIDNLGNEQIMMPGGEYWFPGSSVFEIPMKQQGGATRSDSLALLQNAQTVEDYYLQHPGRYQLQRVTPVTDPNAFWQGLSDAERAYYSQQNVKKPRALTSKGEIQRFGPDVHDAVVYSAPTSIDYKIPGSGGAFQQYEQASHVIDTRAPMTLYNPKINPQAMTFYKNVEKGDPLEGDVIQIGTYDPLAVTPWDMLDEKERQERVEKYGTSGTPYEDGTPVPETWHIKGPARPPKRTTPDPDRSVVDNLNAMGEDSSFANRKKLYEQSGGTEPYKGTSDQNTALNKWLQDGRPSADKPTDDIVEVTEPVETVDPEDMTIIPEGDPTAVSSNMTGASTTGGKRTGNFVEQPKKPKEIIKQKPGAWYRDEQGNLKQWWPESETDTRPPGQEVILSQKYGGAMSKNKGPVPTINAGDIIYPFMPTMNMGGDWMEQAKKDFKRHTKSHFKGDTALQNYDTEKIIDERNDVMTNFLSNNAMRAVAMEEADNAFAMMNTFMQMGGSFGFNPNAYNQNMYAMAGNFQPSLNQSFQDFYQRSMGLMENANPYYESMKGGGKFKYQEGGESDDSSHFTYKHEPGYTYTDGSMAMGKGIRWMPDNTYVDPQGNVITEDEVRNILHGSGSSSGMDDPQANSEYLKNKYYSGEGITDESGNVFRSSDMTGGSNNAGNNRSNNNVGNTGNNAGSFGGTGSPAGFGFGTPMFGGYRAGNYQGNPNMNAGYTPTYASPGYGGGYGGYIPGQSPYGYFPMNRTPHFKLKGSGPMFSGVPGINFDPTTTFLKDYEYKGRLFGQGPRKIKMTFGHGEMPMTGGSGTGTSFSPQIGESYGTNQTLDAYVESQMDPTLYSKMLEGDASPEDIAEFNRQYQQLEQDYSNRGINQARSPITGTDIKPKFGTKVKNWMQERQAEKDRKRRKKHPEEFFETAVHPDLRQFGGGVETAQNASQATAYDNPDAYGDESTLIWKRKMGINPEEAVAWGITGLDALSAFREAQDRSKMEQKYKERMFSDALFQPIQAGNVSRGDYDPNTGMFRPDQQVPVQFTGYNVGQIGSPARFQQGGEYMMSDEEIEMIKAMGGKIEYLD